MPMETRANAAGSRTPMHAALKILSRRQVSTGQMRFMLSEKGFAPDDIQECIGKLEEWNYLNDVDLARNIVEAMIRNTPCGKKRCAYELEKRRFDRELAKALIEQVYADYDERELALAAAKQYARNKTEWTRRDKERLARWLYRRGFTEPTVLSVLRALGQAKDCE
jgi:regulatory protein